MDGLFDRSLFLLVFFVGLIGLQVFLSKRKNKWLGLIFPLFCIFFSVVTILLSISSSWLLIALIMNIPTIIFLVIYFACRGQFNRNNELEKMNILDLE
ncbi:MAG TPA: hypothetical protein DHW61_06890 [Lachnoclostridium phytofermentans]|uniref:Uncharacterized protein n=1 Tax=Lachnoclostridium phytofermentans TaxID=66219 RepID=A0A3D2X685_9FIRM|nr:hypothetical protein [Lachnoclostridium phytofermentans]